MTCCRARRPEEVAEQITALRKAAADLGEDFGRYTVSYQVTMNIGDSAEQASSAFGEYITSYYPELSKSVDLSSWGLAGTPEIVGSIEEGFGRWPISVADIEQTIGNAKKAIARLEGKKRARHRDRGRVRVRHQ
ncbi:MAG: hypothetical protein ACRDOH_04350 [Streptosporangiaceae bacterium]